MNSIVNRIRIIVFVICLILCVPYKVTGETLAGTSPEQLIAHVRAQHFSQYPASEGYATIGEALEKFFSNGAWKCEENYLSESEKKKMPIETIIFTGIAKINERNARFKWVFSIFTAKDAALLFPYGTVINGDILVNDTRATDKERGDIRAAVLLN